MKIIIFGSEFFRQGKNKIIRELTELNQEVFDFNELPSQNVCAADKTVKQCDIAYFITGNDETTYIDDRVIFWIGYLQGLPKNIPAWISHKSQTVTDLVQNVIGEHITIVHPDKISEMISKTIEQQIEKSD